MIDDEQVGRTLSRAGGRQRAAAPTAGDAQRALEQMMERATSAPPEQDRDRPRRWPAALVLAGAAAVLVVVLLVGNSGSDTIRNVPATEPIGPVTSTATSASAPSPTVPESGAAPVELDFAPADSGLSLGRPSVQSNGVPLTDIAVSPGADRIAVARNNEICVVWTDADVPVGEFRCTPSPTRIAPGSVAWDADGTALVFHDDFFAFQQEPDLTRIDLASGEFSVLTDDGVPVDGTGGDVDLAPTFTPDGTLYFFRLATGDGVSAELYRYGADGAARAVGPSVDGIPFAAGRSTADGDIVTLLSTLGGDSEAVSVDVDTGRIRSISVDGTIQRLGDVAGDRALLVSAGGGSSQSLGIDVADFSEGTVTPIEIPGLATSSLRVTGAGLSPDGGRLAVILADLDDPDGHLLLVTDLVDTGPVGPFTVLATGAEFAPNDGDKTIRPAGLGMLGEIVWTDESLVYALGPEQIVTLPLS